MRRLEFAEKGKEDGPGRRWVGAVFCVTLAVYVVCSLATLRYLEPPTGDQPYYLMTTISMLEDGDLDEYNNYTTAASYDQFYPTPLQESAASFRGLRHIYPLSPKDHVGPVANRPAAEWHTKHGLGLSLLIAPGWALGKALTPLLAPLTAGGEGGWPGVILEMNLLGALLAVNVFLWAWQGSRHVGLAAIVWIVLAFSNPLMSYSLLLFTEMPAALCTLYVVRRLAHGAQENSPARWLLVGAVLAFLPWLHARYLPIMVALGLWALYELLWVARRDPRRWRSLAAFLLPLLLSGLLLAGYYQWLYGTIRPNTADHAGFYHPWKVTEQLPVLLASLGLFFDQQWGLLIYTPLFLLWPVGLWVQRHRSGARPILWATGLIILPYLVEIALYKVWWGEWCPPARYLAVITPLSAWALAGTLACLWPVWDALASRVYRLLFAGLAAIGLFLQLTMVIGVTSRLPEQAPTLFNHPTWPPSLFQWLNHTLGLSLPTNALPVVLWFFDAGYSIPWPALLATLLLSLGVIVASCLLLQHARRSASAR